MSRKEQAGQIIKEIRDKLDQVRTLRIDQRDELIQIDKSIDELTCQLNNTLSKEEKVLNRRTLNAIHGESIYLGNLIDRLRIPKLEEQNIITNENPRLTLEEVRHRFDKRNKVAANLRKFKKGRVGGQRELKLLGLGVDPRGECLAMIELANIRSMKDYLERFRVNESLVERMDMSNVSKVFLVPQFYTPSNDIIKEIMNRKPGTRGYDYIKYAMVYKGVNKEINDYVEQVFTLENI